MPHRKLAVAPALQEAPTPPPLPEPATVDDEDALSLRSVGAELSSLRKCLERIETQNKEHTARLDTVELKLLTRIEAAENGWEEHIVYSVARTVAAMQEDSNDLWLRKKAETQPVKAKQVGLQAIAWSIGVGAFYLLQMLLGGGTPLPGQPVNAKFLPVPSFMHQVAPPVPSP